MSNIAPSKWSASGPRKTRNSEFYCSALPVSYGSRSSFRNYGTSTLPNMGSDVSIRCHLRRSRCFGTRFGCPSISDTAKRRLSSCGYIAGFEREGNAYSCRCRV